MSGLAGQHAQQMKRIRMVRLLLENLAIQFLSGRKPAGSMMFRRQLELLLIGHLHSLRRKGYTVLSPADKASPHRWNDDTHHKQSRGRLGYGLPDADVIHLKRRGENGIRIRRARPGGG